MAVLLTLIIALATAIVLIADTGGASAHPTSGAQPHGAHAEGAATNGALATVGARPGEIAEEADDVDESGLEIVYEEDPSSILEAAIVEPAATGIQRMALARLVGSIALSGLVIGLAIVIAAKVLGALLKHFAAGS